MSTCKLRHTSHHREEIRLRVVDGELEDESSSPVIRPRILLQLLDRSVQVVRRAGQLEHVAAAAVAANGG